MRDFGQDAEQDRQTILWVPNRPCLTRSLGPRQRAGDLHSNNHPWRQNCWSYRGASAGNPETIAGRTRSARRSTEQSTVGDTKLLAKNVVEAGCSVRSWWPLVRAKKSQADGRALALSKMRQRVERLRRKTASQDFAIDRRPVRAETESEQTECLVLLFRRAWRMARPKSAKCLNFKWIGEYSNLNRCTRICNPLRHQLRQARRALVWTW